MTTNFVLAASIDGFFLRCCRRKEVPLALTAAGEPVRWQGTTPEGKAMRPANLTKQQYQQLLPLLFEGEQRGSTCGCTSCHPTAATTAIAGLHVPGATPTCAAQNDMSGGQVVAFCF
jgi:hypothetical protein